MLAGLAERAGRALGLVKRGGYTIDFRNAAPYRPNWFQLGAEATGDGALRTNAVFSCIRVLAEEIARIPAAHWLRDPNTGLRTRADGFVYERLRRPNEYLGPTDFWLAVAAALVSRGIAFVFRERR
jgi:Phage-related protein